VSFAPSLRPDIERRPRENGGVELYDPLTDRGLALGELSAALVARLDGTTPLDALLEGTSDEDRRRLLRTVKMLQLLLFLRGSGEHVVARLQEIRAGDPLHHTVLEGARFECQGSGQCCQNYVFGPLTDADIARLDALDLSSFGPGPYWGFLERKDGKQERYLTSTNDRCMFLEGDHRCGIHARFGAEAKPGLCRLYPLEQIATVDGIRLYDKGTCASFATSSRSGPTLVERMPQLLPILAPAHQLRHPIVQLADGLPLDYGYWLAFSDASLRLIEGGALSAAETLRAIAHGAQRLATAIDGYTVATGQPDLVVVSLVREDATTWRPPAGDPRPGALVLRSLFAELQQIFGGIIHARVHQKGENWATARLLREITQIVHLAQGNAAALADPSLELDPYYRDLSAVGVGDASVDEVLRSSLRQQLFGARALVAHRVDAGLLRLALIQILAVTGARIMARTDGRTAYQASDLSYAHMLAVRCLDMEGPENLMIAHADKVAAVLDALPSLVP
jgi:Fe-S-cluster containining protein